jgi:DNA mismatch repair protein MutL
VDFLAGTTSRERLPIEELVLRACKAAIKAGDFMTTLEVTELINSLKQTEDPMTCPHGRPIFVRLTRDELEKRFART